MAHILRLECRDYFKDFNSNACMFFERIKQHYFIPTPYTVRDIMTQLNNLTWNGKDDPTLFIAKYLTLQHDGELLTETSSGARAFPEYSEYSKCIDIIGKIPKEYSADIDTEMARVLPHDYTIDAVKNILNRKWRLRVDKRVHTTNTEESSEFSVVHSLVANKEEPRNHDEEQDEGSQARPYTGRGRSTFRSRRDNNYQQRSRSRSWSRSYCSRNSQTGDEDNKGKPIPKNISF